VLKSVLDNVVQRSVADVRALRGIEKVKLTLLCCVVWQIILGCPRHPTRLNSDPVLWDMAPLSSVWKQDLPLDWNYRQLERLVYVQKYELTPAIIRDS
jgi:hypothetical protein